MEQRWVAQLASFDYDIKYSSGKSNINADALSRFPLAPMPANDQEHEVETAPITAAIKLMTLTYKQLRGMWRHKWHLWDQNTKRCLTQPNIVE